MGAIDNVTNHFDSLTIRTLDVPEWGNGSGDPLVIYAKPLTLGASGKLYKLARDDDMKVMALAILHCAMDEDGKKLFKYDDLPKLLGNADVKIVTKIASWIFESDETIEDIEKK